MTKHGQRPHLKLLFCDLYDCNEMDPNAVITLTKNKHKHIKQNEHTKHSP